MNYVSMFVARKSGSARYIAVCKITTLAEMQLRIRYVYATVCANALGLRDRVSVPAE